MTPLVKLGIAVLSCAMPLAAQVESAHFPATRVGMQNQTGTAALQQMAPMPMVAPVFLEDADTTSSLVIVNNSQINAGATIEVRDLSGKLIGSVRKQLTPHEQLEIPVSTLLLSFGNPIQAGSLTVTQDETLKGMTVASQLLLTRYRGARPAYVDEELAMPTLNGSSKLRAVADQAVAPSLLAVTSIVDWDQHVTLRCLSGQVEYKPVAFTIRSRATALVSNCSGQTADGMAAYTEQIAQHPNQGVFGYELSTDGGPGAFAAFGLTPHQRDAESDPEIVYSALPFTDPAQINSPNTVFAGVAFGAQLALPAGVYAPRLTLTNFASNAATVKVSIATTQEGEAPETPQQKVALRQLTIPARRTVELLLSDTSSANGLLQSLIVDSDRKPGELLGKVVSRSNGDLYEIELLGKDQLDENNGGIHPWSVEGDTQSHLLLFNYSEKPRVFGVGIWNGAVLWDKHFTVAPNETREISFNELIQDEVHDDKGQILSPDRQNGVVNWMVPDSGEGTGRLMVTSRSRAMARNFSCGNFIEICGGSVAWEASGLTVGELGDVIWFIPEYCDFFSPSQCTGGSSVGNGSANYYWNVGTAAITRLSSSSQQSVSSPQLLGVGPGSGSGSVTASTGSCQVGGSGPVPVYSVTITEANIVTDQILVSLAGPASASGQLTVQLVGPSTTTLATVQNAGPGSQTFHFGRNSLAVGDYTSVTASWSPSGTYNTSMAVGFYSLGLVHHTQYNTPYEVACTGAPAGAYVTQSTCSNQQTTLKSDFMSQMNLNGSGFGVSWGGLQVEVYCLSHGSKPYPPAGSTFRDHGPTGSCNANSGTLSASTVAIGSDSILQCNDQILIIDGSNNNLATKTVTDSCPGCSGAHIDDYSTSELCSSNSVGDYGTYMTIRLH